MIIIQQDPSEYAPHGISLEQVMVIDSAGSTTSKTLNGVTFAETSPGTAHYDIRVSGINLNNGFDIVGDDAALVDASATPLLKRINSSVDYATVSISNGRAVTRPDILRFKHFAGEKNYSGPVTLAPGSYAKYSWDAVMAIVNGCNNNRWLTGTDANHLDTRTNLETFPHAETSSICVKGLWANGCRPIAITKRHAITAGHYGVVKNQWCVGKKLYWRDANNGNIIERTITSVLNYAEDPTGGTERGVDVAMMLLNEDLPTEITPIQIAGQWACNASVDYDLKTYSTSRAFFGLTIWGRDGHWQPTFAIDPEINNYPHWFLPPGRGFGAFPNESIYSAPVMSPGFQSGGKSSANWDHWFGLPDYGWGSVAPAKFAHNRISGDSGSPTLIPVSGGAWALVGGETNTIPSKAGLDIIIGQLDTQAEVSTGYTVTEATDPTL